MVGCSITDTRGVALSRGALLDLALAVGLFALVLWRLLPAVETTPFHRDEARWIHRASYLREWRDPFGPRWQDTGHPVQYGSWDERYRMTGQPPLAGYVFGLGLLAQGRDLTTNGFWIMDRDDAWNAAHGNMPTPADLRAARRTNVVVAALTAVAVYALGKRLTNRAGGVVGGVVFALHPLVRDVATRAWSDPLLVLLLAIAAVAASRLAAKPTWPWAALLGALLGLGGATKLSPLLLAVPLALLGLILIGERRLRWRRHAGRTGEPLGWRLLVVPLIAFAVFVASYPYLWPNPVTQTYRLYKFRVDSFDLQARAFPPAAVRDRSDALRRVHRELGRRFSVAGEATAALDERLGTSIGERAWVNDLDLAVAMLGAVLWLAIAARRGLRSAQTLAFAVAGGAAAIVLLGMGVQYARYLLPVLLFESVCIGVVAGAGYAVLRRLGIRPARLTPRLLPRRQSAVQ